MILNSLLDRTLRRSFEQTSNKMLNLQTASEKKCVKCQWREVKVAVWS